MPGLLEKKGTAEELAWEWRDRSLELKVCGSCSWWQPKLGLCYNCEYSSSKERGDTCPKWRFLNA